jgi:hypothetical protein
MAGDAEIKNDLPIFSPQKLYYHTMPRGFIRLMVKIMPLFGKNPRKFGKNQDIDMKAVADLDFPTHARIDYRSVMDIRDEAALCHASQGGGMMTKGLIGWIRKRLAAYEAFMQVHPAPVDRRISSDLFEFVVPDPEA